MYQPNPALSGHSRRPLGYWWEIDLVYHAQSPHLYEISVEVPVSPAQSLAHIPTRPGLFCDRTARIVSI